MQIKFHRSMPMITYQLFSKREIVDFETLIPPVSGTQKVLQELKVCLKNLSLIST